MYRRGAFGKARPGVKAGLGSYAAALTMAFSRPAALVRARIGGRGHRVTVLLP